MAKNKMKILIILPSLRDARGGEKQVINLAIELNKIKNVKASILTFFPKISKEFEGLIKNVNIIVYPKLAFYSRYIHSFYPPIILASNFSKITKDFDLVNLHGFPSTWVTRSINIPSVWMCNAVPWTYPMSRRFKVIFNNIQRIYKKIDYGIVRKKVNKIVVLDKKRKEDVKKFYNLDAKIVRSGININLYKRLDKNNSRKILERILKIKFSGMTLLFVSYLAPIKRLEDFLNTVYKVKKQGIDCTAVVVGKGPESKKINLFKNKIRIIHLSDIDEKLMPHIYNAADIFIFPAIEQPWGLVPFEAMACGTPVIVSKDTGAAEVLKHMENSILVDPLKPDLIAEGVIRLSKDVQLYDMISKNGLKVVKNLSWKKYAKNMLNVFKSIA